MPLIHFLSVASHLPSSFTPQLLVNFDKSIPDFLRIHSGFVHGQRKVARGLHNSLRVLTRHALSYRLAHKPKRVDYDIPPNDQTKEIINTLENFVQLMLLSWPEIHQVCVIPGCVDAPIVGPIAICSDIHSPTIASTKENVTVWKFGKLNVVRSEVLSQTVH